MGRVLIADGDREMRDLLAHALSQEDCRVELVARGEEVLEEIAGGGIDAVVTEVHLVDMPAWRLIPKVHQVDPHMPIIAFSIFVPLNGQRWASPTPEEHRPW